MAREGMKMHIHLRSTARCGTIQSTHLASNLHAAWSSMSTGAPSKHNGDTGSWHGHQGVAKATHHLPRCHMLHTASVIDAVSNAQYRQHTNLKQSTSRTCMHTNIPCAAMQAYYHTSSHPLDHGLGAEYLATIFQAGHTKPDLQLHSTQQETCDQEKGTWQ